MDPHMVYMKHGPRRSRFARFVRLHAGNRDGIYTSQYPAARYITASSKAEAGRRGFARVYNRARASSPPRTHSGTHTQAAYLHRAHT